MSTLRSYGGMLGTRGQVGGSALSKPDTGISSPDQSTSPDDLGSFLGALGQVFPSAGTSFLAMPHDGNTDQAHSIGAALGGFAAPLPDDEVSAAFAAASSVATLSASLQTSVINMWLDAGTAGNVAEDTGAVVDQGLRFDTDFSGQTWWQNINLANTVNGFTWWREPSLINYGQGSYVPKVPVFVTPSGTQTYINGQLQFITVGDPRYYNQVQFSHQQLESFPGLFGGNMYQSYARAARAGLQSLIVQGTANNMWLCRYMYDLYNESLANVTAPDNSAARIDALVSLLADMQVRMNKLHSIIGRVEVETIAGFTALGFGAIFTATWAAGVLATIFGELTTLIGEEAASVISQIGVSAFQLAAEGAAVEAELAGLETQVNAVSSEVQNYIQEQMSVQIATGAKVKLIEFLAGCLVNVNGEYKNLLAEAYVKDNEGNVRPLSDALRGMVYQDVQTGDKKHLLLSMIGMPQANLGV